MAPTLIHSDQVKPLFDLNAEHPFLLRPLSGYEKSIVNHWKSFYKDVVSRRHAPPSQYRDEFVLYLGKRGFKAKTLRDEHGKRDDLLFQGLFKAAPQISLMSAMARITGLNIKLTDDEMREGFREFVFDHKRRTGQLPRRKDFVQANENRMFLPETGIIVPHPLRIQKRLAKNNSQGSNGIASTYRLFFDIPAEISADEVDRLDTQSKYRLDELIDNLRKVQKYMDEQNTDPQVVLTPSRVDIENYARSHSDGIPWNAYESWIYNGTELVGGTPGDAQRSLKWLRDQAGLEQERTFIRRAKNKPRGYWSKDRIYSRFCEAWRANNPRGFQPSRKILADPPTLKDIESMVRIQAQIIAEHGELIEDVCKEQKVPLVEVPSVSTIKERYPGGYQKLLADIERRVEPIGGIQFSSKVALQRMATVHRKSNRPDSCTPMRVARACRALN